MRLKLLLIPDRVGYSPEMILMIKNDVTHTISKYMEVEKGRVQVQMDIEGSLKKSSCRTLPVLHTNMPIRSISNKGLY